MAPMGSANRRKWPHWKSAPPSLLLKMGFVTRNFSGNERIPHSQQKNLKTPMTLNKLWAHQLYKARGPRNIPSLIISRQSIIAICCDNDFNVKSGNLFIFPIDQVYHLRSLADGVGNLEYRDVVKIAQEMNG